jgi:hypothetical protein
MKSTIFGDVTSHSRLFFTVVSEEHTEFIFRVEQQSKQIKFVAYFLLVAYGPFLEAAGFSA